MTDTRIKPENRDYTPLASIWCVCGRWYGLYSQAGHPLTIVEGADRDAVELQIPKIYKRIEVGMFGSEARNDARLKLERVMRKYGVVA